MECTIATLIACFSWSNLYVDTGLLAQDSGVEDRRATYEWYDGSYILQRESDSHYAANPYGRLAIGYGFDLRRVSLSLEVAHVSSLATADDRGVNSLQLRARWYPFR